MEEVRIPKMSVPRNLDSTIRITDERTGQIVVEGKVVAIECRKNGDVLLTLVQGYTMWLKGSQLNEINSTRVIEKLAS